eukprot:NODE_893_length_2710_cov_9.067364.p1 GENE.NODE_893_length_2710_cov_9.067364~~NODE_893_length_2710_cov_9.067364.p1  ORF type:complete len:572 (+),score=100.84 NODE_893_length_2710_cov_9.067364:258-1718(+)
MTLRVAGAVGGAVAGISGGREPMCCAAPNRYTLGDKRYGPVLPLAPNRCTIGRSSTPGPQMIWTPSPSAKPAAASVSRRSVLPHGESQKSAKGTESGFLCVRSGRETPREMALNTTRRLTRRASVGVMPDSSAAMRFRQLSQQPPAAAAAATAVVPLRGQSDGQSFVGTVNGTTGLNLHSSGHGSAMVPAAVAAAAPLVTGQGSMMVPMAMPSMASSSTATAVLHGHGSMIVPMAHTTVPMPFQLPATSISFSPGLPVGSNCNTAAHSKMQRTRMPAPAASAVDRTVTPSPATSAPQQHRPMPGPANSAETSPQELRRVPRHDSSSPVAKSMRAALALKSGSCTLPIALHRRMDLGRGVPGAMQRPGSLQVPRALVTSPPQQRFVSGSVEVPCTVQAAVSKSPSLVAAPRLLMVGEVGEEEAADGEQHWTQHGASAPLGKPLQRRPSWHSCPTLSPCSQRTVSPDPHFSIASRHSGIMPQPSLWGF